LKANYACVAIDLPGHGASFRSNDPMNDYTMQGMANYVLDFIKNEVKENYILVGHSLGCNIIGEIASKLKNCKGILLTSPSIIGKNLSAADIMLPNPTLTPLFSETSTEEEISALIENVAINFDLDAKNGLREDIKKTDGKARTSIFHSIVNAMYCDEITAIEKLNIPFGVVFGEKETLCNIHFLDQLNLNLYEKKPILIAEAGHYLHLDQADKLNQYISEFAHFCF
jgi:pimeloyl-ACP methyl ester carboxylesterase